MIPRISQHLGQIVALHHMQKDHVNRTEEYMNQDFYPKGGRVQEEGQSYLGSLCCRATITEKCKGSTLFFFCWSSCSLLLKIGNQFLQLLIVIVNWVNLCTHQTQKTSLVGWSNTITSFPLWQLIYSLSVLQLKLNLLYLQVEFLCLVQLQPMIQEQSLPSYSGFKNRWFLNLPLTPTLLHKNITYGTRHGNLWNLYLPRLLLFKSNSLVLCRVKTKLTLLISQTTKHFS